MNPPSVFTGSRSGSTNYVHSAPTVRHSSPQPVKFAGTVPVVQTTTHNYHQPKVQVLQTSPKPHVYTSGPSFFSRINPFTYFSRPSVSVHHTYSPSRVWIHSPASLLASSIFAGVLGAALFTLGIVAVEPLLLILGSILAIASAAGIIQASRK